LAGHSVRLRSHPKIPKRRKCYPVADEDQPTSPTEAAREIAGDALNELSGKTAVVTGAATGIGLALARKFAASGMQVVLADRDAAALDNAAAEVGKAGGSSPVGSGVLAVAADVTRPADVERLAASAYDRFGSVDVLCNNAGVLGRILPSWQQPLENWKWVFDVNVQGVVNGIHYFVPRMIEQDTEAYVLNTGSIAGLMNGPFFAPYNASKHAVVSLSECLHHELRAMQTKVRVGVLCPGWVNTGLAKAEEKLPAELRAANAAVEPPPVAAARDQSVRQMVEDAISPEQIADIVFEAIRNDRFYIFPHPERKADVQARMEDIVAERTPVFPAVVKKG
jgi:NAD(P)-dependent dehydrogenase (short-subunit alcohol dehydrogenase family)